MISSIKKFFSLLTKKERRKFYLLVVAMIIMGFTEIAGIGSIAPFLTVVTNPDMARDHQILGMIYDKLGFQSIDAFIIILGFTVLGFVLLRNATAAIVRFIEIRYAEMRGYRLSKRLMAKYLGHPYVFFLNRNSAELSRNVLAEADQAVRSFLIPLLELMTKFVTVTAVIVFLILVDPQVAFIVAAALGVLYGSIYMLVKKVLFQLGKKRLDANRERFKLVREAFGGIKDVKLLGKERVFLDLFARVSKKTARYQSNTKILGSFPKYALDSIVFGAMITMVLYLMMSREGGFPESIALLGLYGLAAFRLMPALDGIFKHVATLRGTQAVVDVIHVELGVVTEEEERAEKSVMSEERLPFETEISLKDIVFTYPEASEEVIKSQSILIPKNSTIGFAGPTGCGKTTLVDIILGLLRPSAGHLSVDGTEITDENLKLWQANLGYVPQTIYLTDDTVTRNIAFGVPEKYIDHDRVKKAARIAHLDEFVEAELPKGYDTFVGEQGIRLSGGQRQRIGIARALYHDPEVLVLDEATSALDGITEAVVMEAIEELAGKKTIILIAHRLSTLKEADTIYLLEKGEIIAHGTYEQLIDANIQFRKMAR